MVNLFERKNNQKIKVNFCHVFLVQGVKESMKSFGFFPFFDKLSKSKYYMLSSVHVLSYSTIGTNAYFNIIGFFLIDMTLF